MDASWTATREVVLPRTDLVVALDYPRRVSLGRREIARWSAAPDGPPVLRFTDPRATDAWVDRLEARAAA